MYRSPLSTLAALLLVASVCLAVGLSAGSRLAGPGELLQVIVGQGDETARKVLLDLRLPRVLAAFGTGAALAMAGALMQVLLRNPLADPYILGTSGGAAVFALLAMMSGLPAVAVNLSAFAGALASTLLVFVLARGSGWAPGRLLLTGVVIAAGWSALVGIILTVSPERDLRGALFWLMGDFAYAGNPLPCLLVALAGGLGSVVLGRSLNVLAAGDQQAALLGLPVRPMRITVYFATAALTSTAVTTAGTIGFVGLLVPHLLRLRVGADHRVVMPGAALLGGSLLVMADTLARTAFAPRQLPVGAITAVIGVPLFLALLRRGAPAAD